MAFTASIDSIKDLRNKTGVSVMQCRQALEEANGDMDKALGLLQKQSARIADKKGERALGAGTIGSYVHTGSTIGVLVELDCETDFVAKTDDFRALAADLAMHIAAMSPTGVSAADAGGSESALLDQSFVRDPAQTVAEVITSAIQKFGENVEVARFARFEVLGK